MNKLKKLLKNIHTSLDNRIFKVGSYSLSASIIVLAILVAVNMMVSTLPSRYTQIDMSAAKLYSVTSQTKSIVHNLEEDVTIYWIVQSGEENGVIEKLLDRYDELSDHLTVEKKDPDIYPTFVEKYTNNSANNNSLVVECGDRYRYIDYNDIYLSDSYYSNSSTSFDGEGAITSAIDYVVNQDFPTVYLLEGHGEIELSESMLNKIEKENIYIESFSLLNTNEVPEDADCVMIYGPQSDISQEEKDILLEYLQNGGRLLVLDGPTEENELTHLESLLEEYGVETYDGIIIEGNQDHYAFSLPYILLPEIQSHEITDPLIESRYYAILPISKGLSIKENVRDTLEITELLTTSSDAYLKVDGYDLQTYEKEDQDQDGPLSLGVAIEENVENGNMRMVWYSSSYVLDDNYESYSSGANSDLILNSLSWLFGEENTISIRSKSLGYEYLVVDSSTSQLIQIIVIGVIPLSYLAVGIYMSLKRRAK